MRWTAAALLAGALFLGACSAKVENHSNTGVIDAIQEGGKVVVIDAPAFPDGFMDAMAMPYDTVDPGITRGLKPGDRVFFTVTRKEGYYPITVLRRLTGTAGAEP